MVLLSSKKVDNEVFIDFTFSFIEPGEDPKIKE
jgi:hypothetical protein